MFKSTARLFIIIEKYFFRNCFFAFKNKNISEFGFSVLLDKNYNILCFSTVSYIDKRCLTVTESHLLYYLEFTLNDERFNHTLLVLYFFNSSVYAFQMNLKKILYFSLFFLINFRH